jgi:hypothetical protein
MDTTVQSSLLAAGNTYNPSLIVLRDKGYDLWLEKGDSGSLWCAKKGDPNHRRNSTMREEGTTFVRPITGYIGHLTQDRGGHPPENRYF